MSDLTQKHCVPCEGGTEPLNSDQEQMYLSAVPEWQLNRELPHTVTRDIQFQDFKEAVGFVNRVAELAEVEGHHPNLTIHDFKFVLIELYTHAIGGLSENDFIMAAKIDQLLSKTK